MTYSVTLLTIHIDLSFITKTICANNTQTKFKHNNGLIQSYNNNKP